MGILVVIGKALRLLPVVIGVAACAHAPPTPSEVPIAFGRWKPPEGQACYVDAFQPRAMPALSTLLDSAAILGELQKRPEGSVLIALVFDSSGRTRRARVIDRRMSIATADSVQALVMSHLRAPATEEGWGARLLASTGASAALTIGRRDVCPPALARIEPLSLTSVAMTEREPDVVPSPDWIIRGAGAPGGPPRLAVERVVAGTLELDSARLTVDSASASPDPMAIGDSVLTLRVLIDTAGTIAHAEISRAAAATIDKVRLVAELARYRFHPALEDRVPTPAWVILRIK
jgi:hypothetical protein